MGRRARTPVDQRAGNAIHDGQLLLGGGEIAELLGEQPRADESWAPNPNLHPDGKPAEESHSDSATIDGRKLKPGAARVVKWLEDEAKKTDSTRVIALAEDRGRWIVCSKHEQDYYHPQCHRHRSSST